MPGFFCDLVGQSLLVHTRNARDASKETDRQLIFVLLDFEIFLRADFLEHRGLWPFDSSLLAAQVLALFARRIGCAIRRLLAGDPLRLAAP